jgi:2-polyprenyl-6-methoxyphenol hydroxylase-like FAD-dependent oxidoreductase
METSVLIVGAGPTGLVLALWLNRLGVSVRIIDKNAEPGTESRAIGIQARTLELYQQIGLAQEIVDKGIKANAFTIRKNGRETFSLSLREMGTGLSPFPFFLLFPQDDHEKILIEHLNQVGINVERNTTLASLTQNTDNVEAVLKTEQGIETVKIAYLCGCDGAHSTVRDALNIAFPGGTYSQLFYVADVIATTESENDNLQMCVTPHDFCLVLPVRSSGSFRLIGIVPSNKKEKIIFDDVTPSILKNTALKIKKLNWFSTYHVHHRVAQQFRKERVFLVGDAAHIHSPAGAQGMNTGIGDAINLAWKIAAVVQHRASPTLLESYEIERMPFANQLVATTDKLFQLMTNSGLLGKCWRGIFFPFILPLLFRLKFIRRYFFKTTSQIKINYRHSPLSAGHSKKIVSGDRLPWVQYGATDNFAPLQSLDWQIHIYGEANAEFVAAIKKLNLIIHVFPWEKPVKKAGLEKNTVYLIRPDGYVAYIDADQDTKKLEDFLSSTGLFQ